MDHAQHTRLAPGELTPDILMDATIYDREDHKIGSISHVHGAGNSAKAVIDVGGFLGLGSKPVSVPVEQLDFMRDDEGHVHAVTNWTKDELKQMPEHHH